MMNTRLIDIGANLTHESFANDLDKVLARAADNGVETMIVTGASISGSIQAIQLAEKYPQLYTTTGIHPHDASHFSTDDIATLKKLAEHPKVVSMGECGLDFNRDFSPRKNQESCFEAQLDLACEVNKPLFLHERDAHDRFIAILEKYRPSLSNVVVHCFTGNESQLQAYLAMDCHIGITGWICDERRGEHLKDFICQIPTNRLMIETDSPYLLPRDLQPKPKSRRNEPAYLLHIAQTLADACHKSLLEVTTETAATSRQFFILPG